MPNQSRSNPDIVYQPVKKQPEPTQQQATHDPVVTKSSTEKAAKIETLAWTVGGNECDHDEPGALAKLVRDLETGSVKYYVKVGGQGSEKGHIYDPQNVTSSGLLVPELKRGNYEYRKVSAEAFESYKKYLFSRSPLDYRNAERTAFNG